MNQNIEKEKIITEWERNLIEHFSIKRRKEKLRNKRIKELKHKRKEFNAMFRHPIFKQELINNFENSCNGCKREFIPGEPIEIDHIIPLSVKGTNELSNLQPLCLSCHMTKHSKAQKKEISSDFKFTYFDEYKKADYTYQKLRKISIGKIIEQIIDNLTFDFGYFTFPMIKKHELFHLVLKIIEKILPKIQMHLY